MKHNHLQYADNFDQGVNVNNHCIYETSGNIQCSNESGVMETFFGGSMVQMSGSPMETFYSNAPLSGEKGKHIKTITLENATACSQLCHEVQDCHYMSYASKGPGMTDGQCKLYTQIDHPASYDVCDRLGTNYRNGCKYATRGHGATIDTLMRYNDKWSAFDCSQKCDIYEDCASFYHSGSNCYLYTKPLKGNTSVWSDATDKAGTTANRLMIPACADVDDIFKETCEYGTRGHGASNDILKTRVNSYTTKDCADNCEYNQDCASFYHSGNNCYMYKKPFITNTPTYRSRKDPKGSTAIRAVAQLQNPVSPAPSRPSPAPSRPSPAPSRPSPVQATTAIAKKSNVETPQEYQLYRTAPSVKAQSQSRPSPPPVPSPCDSLPAKYASSCKYGSRYTASQVDQMQQIVAANAKDCAAHCDWRQDCASFYHTGNECHLFLKNPKDPGTTVKQDSSNAKGTTADRVRVPICDTVTDPYKKSCKYGTSYTSAPADKLEVLPDVMSASECSRNCDFRQDCSSFYHSGNNCYLYKTSPEYPSETTVKQSFDARGTTAIKVPHFLKKGEYLSSSVGRRNFIQSPNGRYQLILNASGDLIHYDTSQKKILWNTNTTSKAKTTYTLMLQDNGNIVLRDDKDRDNTLWELSRIENTRFRGTTRVVLSDSGTLSIEMVDGKSYNLD